MKVGDAIYQCLCHSLITLLYLVFGFERLVRIPTFVSRRMHSYIGVCHWPHPWEPLSFSLFLRVKWKYELPHRIIKIMELVFTKGVRGKFNAD